MIVGWKDRVKEYMHGRGADIGGGFEEARRECIDRKRWRLFCHGCPLDVELGASLYRTIYQEYKQ